MQKELLAVSDLHVTFPETREFVANLRPGTGRSSRAASSCSDGQFPIQFAATSSTITPAASGNSVRRVQVFQCRS
jgi:hypothetical protein